MLIIAGPMRALSKCGAPFRSSTAGSHIAVVVVRSLRAFRHYPKTSLNTHVEKKHGRTASLYLID
jgi:hypothetical protein